MVGMNDPRCPVVPLPESCLHCNQTGPLTELGLCVECAASPRWVLLYSRRKPRWTPAWEMHLRRMAERVRLKLPLFEEGYEPPPPGGSDRRKRRFRLPHVFRCQPRRHIKQDGDSER
jgi:hypothetical protein